MKSVVVRRPGGHEALELVDSSDPVAGPGQVRVRVRAAGINYADTIVREGWYEAAKGKYPITPGFEFAGVVDQSLSPSFKPGDWVFGFTRFGGYSSIQIAEPGRLRPIPPGWSFADCAGAPWPDAVAQQSAQPSEVWRLQLLAAVRATPPFGIFV